MQFNTLSMGLLYEATYYRKGWNFIHVHGFLTLEATSLVHGISIATR